MILNQTLLKWICSHCRHARNNYLQLLCKELIEFLLYRGFPRPSWPAKSPYKRWNIRLFNDNYKFFSFMPTVSKFQNQSKINIFFFIFCRKQIMFYLFFYILVILDHGHIEKTWYRFDAKLVECKDLALFAYLFYVVMKSPEHTIYIFFHSTPYSLKLDIISRA